MTPRLIDAKYTSEYLVWLKFNDGRQGIVNLKDELWGEVFEPLKQKDFFNTVKLDKELNTIFWDNGADFAPEFLYEKVKA